MEYTRSFVIQSCHFNDNTTYDAHDKALEAAAAGQHDVAFDFMQYVLQQTHGHNFDITVTARNTDLLADSDCARGVGSWVVEDKLLRDTVAQWDNTNLSVHPDFEGLRATTENMAGVLAAKLANAAPSVGFEVIVREHPEVIARATAGPRGV